MTKLREIEDLRRTITTLDMTCEQLRESNKSLENQLFHNKLELTSLTEECRRLQGIEKHVNDTIDGGAIIEALNEQNTRHIRDLKKIIDCVMGVEI